MTSSTPDFSDFEIFQTIAPIPQMKAYILLITAVKFISVIYLYFAYNDVISFGKADIVFKMKTHFFSDS